MMTTWHEDDAFWETMAANMFSPERWAGTPVEIDNLIQLLDMPPGRAILDLGCGPGRHSLELARRGHQVTGVDRTVAYLEQARTTAAQETLEVEFIQEDMRSFCQPESFDLALLLFTTFSYFAEPEENQLVLRNVFRSLKPGGSLVIEMMGKEILARIFQERGWHENEDGVIFLEERRVEKDWSWMENRWIRIDGAERTEFRISHWIYSAAELTAMLKAAGFQTVEIYDGLEGRPYDHTARRLVAVAYR